ncbi:MAG: histidinol-phosphate transaminase, partial [Chloroflexi bacterium]
MTLTLKPYVQTSPVYVAGASIESIRQTYGLEEVIKLASNENPFGPSPRAVEAIAQAAGGLNRYPPMTDDALRQALADTLGRGLTPAHFVTGNGGSEVLAMIAAVFLSPGDEFIISRPTFPMYEITARRAGAHPVYADLDPEQFTYRVDAILAAVTGRTRLVYLCSPNNPTGTIITAAQMDELIRRLPRHVLVVSDEVYFHYVSSPDYPDSLRYVLEDRNVIIIHSFSKAYGLAGLRLGYAIAPPGLAGYLARARQPFHLSQPALSGGLAALKDQAHLTKTISLTRQGRAWLSEQLRALRLAVWPAEGNFILFKPPFAAAEVSERLLRRGVIVRPMTQFYLPTHLRVTVGEPEENARFITALKEVLAELKAEGAPETTDTGPVQG